MKFSLAFSPCPNDTFIFDALVNKKIDTGDIDFEVALEDVQALNENAMAGKYDITKLSYGVLPLVLDKYVLLNSGSALGKGCGPLLIRNKECEISNKKVEDYTIAIPGQNTTAHLLFSLAYPTAKNKTFLRYDKIEDFVAENRGLGVIIHENRFTYEAKGLHKITDLGDYWEQQSGSAIPLGGIAMSRNVVRKISLQIQQLIKQSTEYAFANNYEHLTDYVKQHAQEMSEEVMRKHIDLYVNNYTIDLDTEGKHAVEKLLQVFSSINPSVKIPADIFLT